MPDAARLTADDIHHAAFAKPPIGRRGYSEDGVDEFLDALEAKFRDPADPQLAWLTPDEVRRARFGRPQLGMRGYHKDDVDALLRRAAADLAHLIADNPVDHHRASAPAAASGLSADDIGHIAFRRPPIGRRGYNETQVDDFLDAVEAKFRDRADPAVAWLTPTAIGEATFGPPDFGKRGYRREDVRPFLERCRTELDQLLRGS